MNAKLGLKSYIGKDDYPIAGRIRFLQNFRMTEKDVQDPFIEGFRILLEMRQDLSPAKISTDAGMDNSTLRKLLSGENASPRFTTAVKLAEAAGYSVNTIVALGKHPGARDALELLRTYESLGEDAQRDFETYLEFLASRKEKA